MSCPRAWLQAQPVTHLPTGPEVSHGGPGDGKETHKHGQVGRAVLEAAVGRGGGEHLPRAPSLSAHTQTPMGLQGRRTPVSKHVPFWLLVQALPQPWKGCQHI